MLENIRNLPFSIIHRSGTKSWFGLGLALSVALGLSGCSSDGDGGGDASTRFTVGGDLSGLDGTLVLQNNDKDDLSLTADGGFIFSEALAKDASYAVTIKTQPAGQRCTVSQGSGTLTANVTDVAVACVTPVASAAYVTNNTDGTVSTFSADATTGALTGTGSAIAAGALPQAIAVEPTGRFAYVGRLR